MVNFRCTNKFGNSLWTFVASYGWFCSFPCRCILTAGAKASSHCSLCVTFILGLERWWGEIEELGKDCGPHAMHSTIWGGCMSSQWIDCHIRRSSCFGRWSRCSCMHLLVPSLPFSIRHSPSSFLDASKSSQPTSFLLPSEIDQGFVEQSYAYVKFGNTELLQSGTVNPHGSGNKWIGIRKLTNPTFLAVILQKYVEALKTEQSTARLWMREVS